MKKIIVTFVSALMLCAVNAQEPGIHFEKSLSWKQVVSQAKKEHKFIFVDCYATWCEPCKYMDKEIYPMDTIGGIVNPNFISVKLQCDTSKKDDAVIKARYSDAHYIATTYHVTEYPTMLFFSPEGKAIHRAVGAYDVENFFKLISNAQNPNTQYYPLLEKYNSGKLSLEQLPFMADAAKELGDTALFNTVGRKYLREYTDHLSDDRFFTTDNLKQVAKFSKLLASDENTFIRIKSNIALADTVMHKPTYVAGVVITVIRSQDINPVVKKGKDTGVEPDWKEIENTISEKYGKEAVGKLVILEKMNWYRDRKNWETYCEELIKFAEFEPDYAQDFSDKTIGKITNLNQAAWDIFQHSNNKATLERALSWSTIIGNTITDKFYYAAMVTDTKANLLYKLGRKEEALPVEEKATKLSPDDKEIQANFQKMKAGAPTW